MRPFSQEYDPAVPPTTLKPLGYIDVPIHDASIPSIRYPVFESGPHLLATISWALEQSPCATKLLPCELLGAVYVWVGSHTVLFGSSLDRHAASAASKRFVLEEDEEEFEEDEFPEVEDEFPVVFLVLPEVFVEEFDEFEDEFPEVEFPEVEFPEVEDDEFPEEFELEDTGASDEFATESSAPKMSPTPEFPSISF